MTIQKLSKQLTEKQFRHYYYLKEDLISFCRQEHLQTTGSKQELTDRIAHYLTTGERQTVQRFSKKNTRTAIRLSERIEENIVCSEVHRAFFKEQIGPQFSFNVMFQKWLKQNAGKTYEEAVTAYQEILAQKKAKPTQIAQQFEYNAYIRSFFAANKGRKLSEAIACWNYKKTQPGSNEFEIQDMEILKEGGE